MRLLDGIKIVWQNYGAAIALGMEGENSEIRAWADGFYNRGLTGGEFHEVGPKFGYVLVPTIVDFARYLVGAYQRKFNIGKKEATKFVKRDLLEMRQENFL
jgi:hypothetical protein